MCEEKHGVKISESAKCVVTLDATIFHPQGGGQPSDVGRIIFCDGDVIFAVSKVVKSPISAERTANLIWHIGVFEKGFASERTIGTRVRQEIDRNVRMTSARVHSAGHLVDVGMKMCGVALRPGKGYHFSKGAYVEYLGKVDAKVKATLKERLQKACDKLVEADVKTTVHYVVPADTAKYCHNGSCGDLSHLPSKKKVRVVCVADTKGCPCGGTHVKSTGEIRKITITKIKNKQGNTRVSYRVEN